MKLKRALRYGALVGLLIVAIAACSSDSKGSSPSSTSPTTASGSGASLQGTRWNLEQTPALLLGGVAITASFDENAVDGSSGCNQYNAPYVTKGKDGLRIGPQIASTAKACEPGPTAVEQAYLARLPQVRTFVISGTTLSMNDSSGVPILVYKASEGASEISGKWTVTTYYTGDAVQTVENGSLLTAEFKGDQVVGDSGCNNFTGPYDVTGHAIKMGPFVSTCRACASVALQAQEQQYLAALGLATDFKVTGNTLGLTRADGGVAVTFTKG